MLEDWDCAARCSCTAVRFHGAVLGLLSGPEKERGNVNQKKIMTAFYTFSLCFKNVGKLTMEAYLSFVSAPLDWEFNNAWISSPLTNKVFISFFFETESDSFFFLSFFSSLSRVLRTSSSNF